MRWCEGVPLSRQADVGPPGAESFRSAPIDRQRRPGGDRSQRQPDQEATERADRRDEGEEADEDRHGHDHADEGQQRLADAPEPVADHGSVLQRRLDVVGGRR